MARRIVELDVFILSSRPYLEDSLALTLLSPQGLHSCYDHYFFQQRGPLFPFLKESHCRAELLIEHKNIYLKKIELLHTLQLSPHLLKQWYLFHYFVFSHLKLYPDCPDIYSFYFFLYQKLAEEDLPQERLYFFYTYCYFHILDRCQIGHFLHHCEEILRCLNPVDQQSWHENFIQRKLSLFQFQKVLQYLKLEAPNNHTLVKSYDNYFSFF